jgi:hypothetical protein
MSPPRVVVPIYDGPAGPVLWDGDNPWRAAWEAEVGNLGLVDFVVPLGDLQDGAAIGVTEALAFDQIALETLAARYGADQAIVARATPQAPAPDGSARVRVTARSSAPGSGAGIDLTAAGASEAAALAAAVAEIDAWQSAQWRDANLLRVDQAGSLEVRVPLTTLADWVAVDRFLTGRRDVERVRVVSFARREAALRIDYLGSLDRLQGALAEAGFALAPEGDRWLLQPTIGQPAGLPAVPPAF